MAFRSSSHCRISAGVHPPGLALWRAIIFSFSAWNFARRVLAALLIVAFSGFTVGAGTVASAVAKWLLADVAGLARSKAATTRARPVLPLGAAVNGVIVCAGTVAMAGGNWPLADVPGLARSKAATTRARPVLPPGAALNGVTGAAVVVELVRFSCPGAPGLACSKAAITRSRPVNFNSPGAVHSTSFILVPNSVSFIIVMVSG